MTDFDYFCPLKNLSHPVWAYDHIKMKIVWANGAAVELWSTKTNADLLQRDIILSLPESLRTKKEDQIEALKKGKSIVELWNISEEVPVKCKSTGHTLPDGRFIILVEGLSQSHHIISEDLRLLEGSRFTRARIAQFGLEGNLISQNPSSSKTFGHSSLEGRFSNREDYLEFIEKIKEKKYLTTEFLLDCLGEQKWFSLNAKIHNDPVTKKEVILVDFRDVAEKRKLQKKLELFYDNSPFGFAFCDMDGKLIEVNFAYCDILGYSNKQDVLDLTYWDLTPKKYKEQEEIQLHKLNTMGFYGPYRKEYIRQDGGLIDVELYGFIVENYEGVRGIWSIIQDVSKEKLFKDEIQTQKAMTYQQSQLALLGELSAGLGHEVNNPLSIISGSIELIYKLINKKEIDIERLRSLIDQSNTAVKRISDITAGMRVFTKIDQSKTKEFSVEDSLLETVELLNKIYSKEGVELKYNSSLEKGWCLKGVRSRIQQIFLNLLSNSKDATEGQEKREIVITSKIENSTLKIEFKDNGSGIPEKIIDQVVTPFFTTKEFGKGTGLGLAIVNSVVKEHGGELSIDSQMGKGTQINISLPVIRRIGPIEEIDKTVFDPKMLAGLNILIVDDEEPIRDLLEVFLEEVKANVTTAESGSKALEIIQNQNFDLAIVDVKMPGMSGPKLLESIRSQNNINQPKVLLVTGGLHLDLEDEGMGFFEKMDGFLYKPFTQGEIFQAVCRAIYKKEK